MNDKAYSAASDWIAAAAAAMVAGGVYGATLAPAIGLEYAGQLVVAADHLGVARPPGYPVWTLLAKGFTLVFGFVPFRGHPNPAWAVNLMSALFGAVACGLLALLVARETRRLFADAPARAAARISGVCGFAAALLFGFSPLMWSQAVIAETHTLTNAWALLVLLVLLRSVSEGRPAALRAAAVLFAFGLAVSPLLVLAAPVVLVGAGVVSRRCLAEIGTALGLFLAFLVLEYRFGENGPAIAAAILGGLLAAIGAALIFRATRGGGLTLLMMLLMLTPYAYLPIAASGNPPMNMGYAVSWSGFWHVLHRGQYEVLTPLNPFADPARFVQLLQNYLRLAALQFTAPLLSIAAVPVLALPMLPRAVRRALYIVLTAFLSFGLLNLAGANLSGDLQTQRIGAVVFLPSFALLAVLIGFGLALLLRALRNAFSNRSSLSWCPPHPLP